MTFRNLRPAIALACGLVGLAPAALAATVSLPDNAGGGTGTVVQVPISVAPGDGLLGIDMTINYDDGVLTAQNVVVSGIAAQQGFAVVRNLNTPGVIVISEYATQDALVGSGEIASIQFLVVGAYGATSLLHFASVTINEGPATPDDGHFTVTCAGAANGSACNDGNACTASDACQGGTCTGVPLTVPVEVANLRIGADKATIAWDSASAAGPGTVHDVLRGTTNQFPVGSGAETCLAPGIAAATTSDGSSPPLLVSYWYLVRGRNACGIGTYGFRGIHETPGAERTSSTCP